MGQGFAPAPNSGGLASSNAPPVLGRNPETYGNYMLHQQNARLSDIQNNTPTEDAVNNIGQLMQPNQIQPSTVTGYLPTNLPQAPIPPNQQQQQQANNGLSSLLPGQGGFS